MLRLEWALCAKDDEPLARYEFDLGSAGKSLCVIARTIKGWGVPNLAGMGHHGTPVTQD
jgi:hypothetical protein